MIITKDSIIGDVLETNAKASAPVFLETGIHCLRCPAAKSETIGEACKSHAVEKLNKALEN